MNSQMDIDSIWSRVSSQGIYPNYVVPRGKGGSREQTGPFALQDLDYSRGHLGENFFSWQVSSKESPFRVQIKGEPKNQPGAT